MNLISVTVPAEWADAGQVVVPSLVALAVVFFTLTYNRGKEIRDMRRAAYVKWVQFVDSVGSWAWEPRYAELDQDRQQAAFKREIKDIMAELELVASRRVWTAANAFFKELASDESQSLLAQAFATEPDPDQLDLELTVRLAPARARVMAAMRRDVGTRTWKGWVTSRFSLIGNWIRTKQEARRQNNGRKSS